MRFKEYRFEIATPHYVVYDHQYYFCTHLFPLVKQICLGTPQINNLWTPVAILAHLNTLPTIISICDAIPPADYAFTFKATVIALVANVHDCGGVDEAVTDDAFAVAFFAESTEGYAGLLATHYKIGMVLGHC